MDRRSFLSACLTLLGIAVVPSVGAATIEGGPIEDIRLGMEAMLRNTGMKPNMLYVGQHAYKRILEQKPGYTQHIAARHGRTC